MGLCGKGGGGRGHGCAAASAAFAVPPPPPKWGIQEKQGLGQEDGMRLGLCRGWHGEQSAPRPWGHKMAHRKRRRPDCTDRAQLGGLCLAL